MSELENCCGTTCDKEKLAAEITEKDRVIAELSAQVELMRNALTLVSGSYGVMLMSNPPQDAWQARGVSLAVSNALSKAPTKYLAEHNREVAARAVEKFGEHLIWDRLFSKSEIRDAVSAFTSEIKSGEVEI